MWSVHGLVYSVESHLNRAAKRRYGKRERGSTTPALDPRALDVLDVELGFTFFENACTAVTLELSLQQGPRGLTAVPPSPLGNWLGFAGRTSAISLFLFILALFCRYHKHSSEQALRALLSL